MEAQLQAFEFSIETMETRVQVAEEKAISVRAQAIEDYRKSKDFKNKVAKGSLDAYKIEFTKYKKKVAKAFSALDMSRITDLESKEKVRGEEEGEEETNRGVETEAKPVGTKEVIETFEIDPVLILKQAIVDSKG